MLGAGNVQAPLPATPVGSMAYVAAGRVPAFRQQECRQRGGVCRAMSRMLNSGEAWQARQAGVAFRRGAMAQAVCPANDADTLFDAAACVFSARTRYARALLYALFKAKTAAEVLLQAMAAPRQ